MTSLTDCWSGGRSAIKSEEETSSTQACGDRHSAGRMDKHQYPTSHDLMAHNGLARVIESITCLINDASEPVIWSKSILIYFTNLDIERRLTGGLTILTQNIYYYLD